MQEIELFDLPEIEVEYLDVEFIHDGDYDDPECGQYSLYQVLVQHDAYAR